MNNYSFFLIGFFQLLKVSFLSNIKWRHIGNAMIVQIVLIVNLCKIAKTVQAVVIVLIVQAFQINNIW